MDMLRLARAGKNALLVAATGSGKTLAGFLPTIAELTEKPTEGLHTLYISPPARAGACPSGAAAAPIRARQTSSG